jgi:hypothetical protein
MHPKLASSELPAVVRGPVSSASRHLSLEECPQRLGGRRPRVRAPHGHRAVPEANRQTLPGELRRQQAVSAIRGIQPREAGRGINGLCARLTQTTNKGLVRRDRLDLRERRLRPPSPIEPTVLCHRNSMRRVSPLIGTSARRERPSQRQKSAFSLPLARTPGSVV